MTRVLDANNVIHREIPAEGLETMYTTSSVVAEIRDPESKYYLESNMIRIEVRDPKDEYIQQVRATLEKGLLYLSSTDIDVVALTLELSEQFCEEWVSNENLSNDRTVVCSTRDNGMRNALNRLGLLEAGHYLEKKFKLRCYGCEKMYDEHVDFCSNCGYNTITRVTVVETDEGEKAMLKKNFVPRIKTLKGDNGVNIIAADQKEYARLVKQRERIAKYHSRSDFFD